MAPCACAQSSIIGILRSNNLDIKILHNLNVENLTSLWYPFNSYAQDYPVCYKFTDKRKKDIHLSMHNNRKAAVEKCVKALKPKLYFPNSADFVLNGPTHRLG